LTGLGEAIVGRNHRISQRFSLRQFEI
jgi:hypothetical protein